MKRVIVTFAEDGTATVETTGFKGAECLKATEALERALGGATSTTKTREFHERATEPARARS